jgi:hypothetical protein
MVTRRMQGAPSPFLCHEQEKCGLPHASRSTFAANGMGYRLASSEPSSHFVADRNLADLDRDVSNLIWSCLKRLEAQATDLEMQIGLIQREFSQCVPPLPAAPALDGFAVRQQKQRTRKGGTTKVGAQNRPRPGTRNRRSTKTALTYTPVPSRQYRGGEV